LNFILDNINSGVLRRDQILDPININGKRRTLPY
jgi:hypothetical protein